MLIGFIYVCFSRCTGIESKCGSIFLSCKNRTCFYDDTKAVHAIVDNLK